ncbi:hypothetical protein H0H87_012503, partial [Tephrocybe sp. NHM501043]
KAGAAISNIQNADVILVDGRSDYGRGFIREWGKDADKVILEHLWVSACIAAAKFLGKDDEWGGFLSVDDGLPIGSGETELEGMETQYALNVS